MRRPEAPGEAALGDGRSKSGLQLHFVSLMMTFTGGPPPSSHLHWMPRPDAPGEAALGDGRSKSGLQLHFVSSTTTFTGEAGLPRGAPSIGCDARRRLERPRWVTAGVNPAYSSTSSL